MAGFFLTVTRFNVKPGMEEQARALLEQELKTTRRQHSEVVPGMVGIGLMRAKKQPIYGLAVVWENEQAFHDTHQNPKARDGGGLLARLAEYCDGVFESEAFYLEQL
jgi:heme-degrading monooxygenase HmoA